MDNEKIFRVLKCYNNDYDLYIYSTVIGDNFSEVHKYYSLSVESGFPIIRDIINPIDTLKSLDVKPLNIMDNNEEYVKFLAYKNLAENELMKKMSI